MKKLNIAFFGAPEFSAYVLQRIIEDVDIPVTVAFVVTQPDRPVGRKQILTPTPVKKLAEKHQIPVFDTLKLEILNSKLKEVDLVLLYAYGELIPETLLKIPRWGFWNIHPSLLPLYRGASPIVYPLLLGDTKTGVSLIQMDEHLDHGPIIGQEEYEVQSTDSQELVRNRLSEKGYKLFYINIQLLIDGALHKKEQDNSQATYTRLLTKQDGFVPYSVVQKIIQGKSLTEDEIPPILSEYHKKYPSLTTNHYSLITYFDLFRALTPWPGIWTLVIINGVEKRLKITGMELKDNKPVITRVQMEGKREVDFSTFLTAYQESLDPSRR